jgi:transposase-like protein
MERSKYTDEQKEDARRRLTATRGDVRLVSLQTRIPERTLFRWKRSWQQNPLPLPTDDPFGIPREQFIQSLDAQYQDGEYTELREELMRHIKKLSQTLSDNPDLAYRRAIALTRLLDKVFKLEALTRIEKPQPFIIKYEYDGRLHNEPPWKNEAYAEANAAYWDVLTAARDAYAASLTDGTDNATATLPPSPDGTNATESDADGTPPSPVGNTANFNLFPDDNDE